MPADKDLDRLDREILRLLAVDASLSLQDIAGKVGLTPTPCWKRIRRMEQEGVIQRRIAVVDPDKIERSLGKAKRVIDKRPKD